MSKAIGRSARPDIGEVMSDLLKLISAIVLFLYVTKAFAQNESAAQDLVPLKLYWSNSRGDNFVTATPNGESDAMGSGYTFSRIEACVFRTQKPGTVPLKLYWSEKRGDHFTTATQAGFQGAENAGYKFSRIEGYVWPSSQSGTIPLKLFWSSQREDNFTSGTSIGEQQAREAGYIYSRVEGYAYPASECAIEKRHTVAEPPICERARSARARKSPAAAALETQCSVAKGEYKIGEWSQWDRREGVEYRYRANWNPKDTKYVTAVFQIRNIEGRVWRGAARSVNCSPSTLENSEDVVLQPNEIREVTFRAINCGTKDSPEFKPSVVKSRQF